MLRNKILQFQRHRFLNLAFCFWWSVAYNLSASPSWSERSALIPPQRLWPMTTMTSTLRAQTAYSMADPTPAYLVCAQAAVRQWHVRWCQGAEAISKCAEAYLVVGWDHAGDVADGEGLAGLQAQGHRRAHAGVGAGEHHVLQRKANNVTISRRTKKKNIQQLASAGRVCAIRAWFLLSAENHRYFRNFPYIRRVR
jgi:hypothetical protein